MANVDAENISDTIAVYKLQLTQIENALLVASEDQKSDLIQLQKDLKDIIELTESSLGIDSQVSSSSLDVQHTDGIHSSIDEDLKSLEGTKCRAPFTQEWGNFGYHNAVVLESRTESRSESESDDFQIIVKVAFVHPIHNKMKPCPYYLEGKCRFSDDKCRFSHGYEVSLDSVQDYREPDYSCIKKGTAVLCKHHEDGLWYPAKVEEVHDNNKLTVKYESYNDLQKVELHDVVPIDDTSEETSQVSDEDSQSDFLPRVVETSDNPSEAGYGSWEKHTKGIGSKLMSKMGYVEGQGLGKQGEGRLDPIEALVFPPGRSLDRCMELRENADNSDLFKVEKRLERQKLKEERKLRQIAAAAEKQNRISVFDFLNVKLVHGSAAANVNSVQPESAESALKETSTKGLNLQSFQISEDIKRVEREIVKLKESIERQSGRKDMAAAGLIRIRLEAKEKELQQLKTSERSISKEQKQRKSSSKLTIF